MHRFFIEPGQSREKLIELNERETHHALHVLRVNAGERVSALDGEGSELLCQVQSVGKQKVVLEVYQRNSVPPLPYRVTLVQAVPKGKAMETVIQKAAELGAWRVVPVISDRTVIHLDEENGDSKRDKWRLIAIDSIKQCGSAWLPKIESPLKLNDYLSKAEKTDVQLIASLQGGSKHPRVFLNEFKSEKKRAPKSLTVWVGPEGDFTPAEVNAIQNSGALPITLGQLVLRSETAAIYCLSVLNYEMQSPSETVA